jgi:hypothetical protein
MLMNSPNSTLSKLVQLNLMSSQNTPYMSLSNSGFNEYFNKYSQNRKTKFKEFRLMNLFMRFLVVGKNPFLIYTKDYYVNNSLAEILLRYSKNYIIWVNPHTKIVNNYRCQRLNGNRVILYITLRYSPYLLSN